MFKTQLKTNLLLHVAYFKLRGLFKTEKNAQIDEFAQEISTLVESVFIHFTEDKKISVTNSLNHGNVFVLFAMNHSGNS